MGGINVGAVAGGMDTTHLSAAEADRAHRRQREALALSYLTRKGLLDVAEMLGLIETMRGPVVSRDEQGRWEVTR